ncbi:MAG: YgiQ family radical SAM protein [Rikenellaceae bacterium]|nr:YgiQ family radical SAM protein [Rikenellaceae bacterium]
MKWLPTTAKEVKARGWDELDIILFTGDAYVDHPSFGAAVIGRVLEAHGYRVAIVPQPNWRDDLRDFRKLGKPRLFFGVTAGNMDSMVNHYTANKRLRSDDAYTPGNKSGFRPDYPSVVYTRILKRLFPSTPVVIGGIEASLRRLAHYDYWQDKIMPSILIDSGADLLSYGMGDTVMPKIAKALKNGFNMNLLRKIEQAAFVADKKYVDRLENKLLLNSYEKCVEDKFAFCENFTIIETESNKIEGMAIVEPVGDKFVVVNPPAGIMTGEELDKTYELPFTRLPHPRYNGKGYIPAYEMIKFSVNIHRGCFGGCSFCTISAHQGKHVVSRSENSVLKEIERLKSQPDFKGILSDLGGPSANMYGMKGRNADLCRKCARPSCIYPSICKNLNNDHDRVIKLYRKARSVKGVKKIFIGSGIRYDMFINDDKCGYLGEIIEHHVSGRLKVAPEHTEESVLKTMRKPSFELYRKLHGQFREICVEKNLPYQIVPYFISSHPSCREADMAELAGKVGRLNLRLEQVQDFTPTPMTLSSVMFATGLDPYTKQKIFVETDSEKKKRQRSYFFN